MINHLKNCVNRIAEYRKTLVAEDSFFGELLIEDYQQALSKECSGAWVNDFYDRYRDFSKIGQ